jgi:6-phosphogluconate dehydrogenase
MRLGIIGLGRMGGNIARRLLRGGHQVVAYNRSPDKTKEIAQEGAEAAFSLDELVSMLDTPRIVWSMLPAGDATEDILHALTERLSRGDFIIEGGNSNYKDTQRRGKRLTELGFHFVDVGTSGGIWGLSEGYSLMVGGEAEVVEQLHPIFETLAPAADRGWGHVGPTGAGHFVKMVHNGVEYGMMQALAEGFDVLHSKKEFDLDLHQVAEIWRYGSVIRSWLLDLSAQALEENQDLSGIRGWVADSGEGRWTVAEAIDLDVPAPVITLSLLMRLASRQDESYAAKLLAAMRNKFGGHAIKTEPEG